MRTIEAARFQQLSGPLRGKIRIRKSILTTGVVWAAARGPKDGSRNS
jgi:hypothetical protein